MQVTREALSNVGRHAEASTCRVSLYRSDDQAVLEVDDDGKGFDPETIADPLAPENRMKTSGRGIFLIRSFMDVVEIHPSQAGTELKMIKHVHGSAADSKEASQ